MSDLLDIEQTTPTNLVETPVNLPAAPTPATMLAENQRLIAAMSINKDVDPAKMKGLFDLQVEMMAKQAEINFNKALFRAQKNMPRVGTNGAIKNKAGQVVAKYMLLQDIDKAIREIYEAEGFSVMDSQRENANGTVTIISTLVHEGGHSKTIECTLPRDKENSLKSALQAAVGTITTGKRVNICNFFRIIAEDDTNAEKMVAENNVTISDDQAAQIKDLIRETGTDTQRFLSMMVSDAKTVDEIGLKDFNRVYNALLAKRNKGGAQ